MADNPRDFDLPEAVAAPKRRRSPQLVWLIPIVAVLVGGWLAVKAVLEQGPTITITFKPRTKVPWVRRSFQPSAAPNRPGQWTRRRVEWHRGASRNC